MRQYESRLLRLMMILIVMVCTVEASGGIGKASSDNPLACWLAYSFQTRACGVPQSCEAGILHAGWPTNPSMTAWIRPRVACSTVSGQEVTDPSSRSLRSVNLISEPSRSRRV